MSATRQSWKNLQTLPAARASLSIQREFSEQEFERIGLGFIPERMEDKWFLFMEDDTLYIHRSWTGFCIYELHLVKEGSKYRVCEAFVNRDEDQYGGRDDRYDEKLMLFLIDHLLLNQRSPSPVGTNLPAGILTELQHHHILGAGPRTERGPIQLTLGGMLKGLWGWLTWLIRR